MVRLCANLWISIRDVDDVVQGVPICVVATRGIDEACGEHTADEVGWRCPRACRRRVKNDCVGLALIEIKRVGVDLHQTVDQVRVERLNDYVLRPLVMDLRFREASPEWAFRMMTEGQGDRLRMQAS